MAKLSTATFPPGVHERCLYDLEYGEQTADLQPGLFRRQLVRLSHPPAPPEEATPIKNSSPSQRGRLLGMSLAFV